MTLRNVDTLFLAEHVHVFGAARTVAQNQILDNLRASELAGLTHIDSGVEDAQLPPEVGKCAVIFDPEWGRPARISALAEAGSGRLFGPYRHRLAQTCCARPAPTLCGYSVATRSVSPIPATT
jgi:hypothetical protein